MPGLDHRRRGERARPAHVDIVWSGAIDRARPVAPDRTGRYSGTMRVTRPTPAGSCRPGRTPDDVNSSIVGRSSPRRSPRCAPSCRTATPSRPGSRRSNCLLTAHVVGVAELFDLALAQPTDRACEQPGDLGAERGGEIGGPSEQEVAGQDRLQVAPFCVDRVDAAPSVSLVEHVVVVQRSEVHEVAGHAAEHDVVVGRRASDCGGDNGDHRPQSLAAARVGHAWGLVPRGDGPQRATWL